MCHTDLQQDISRASFSHQIERVLFCACFSCEFLVRVPRTSFSCVCHGLKTAFMLFNDTGYYVSKKNTNPSSDRTVTVTKQPA